MKRASTTAIPFLKFCLEVVLFVAAMLAFLTSNTKAAVLPPDVVFEGRTLSEWSVEAWRWIYSFPAALDPSFDCEGLSATQRQPMGNVFFVAPLTGATPPPCIRTFEVPENKYLLVPVLPITADNIDTVPPLAVEQLYDMLDSVTADPEALYAFIDGVSVTNVHQYRATAPPFHFVFPDADNHFSAFYPHPVSGLVDPVVVDGYWLLLEPLPLGPHVLHTGGRFRGVPFFYDHEIIANITVVPPNRPPIADAGATPARVISIDGLTAKVVLDGSRSSDLDQDSLTFTWLERSLTIAAGSPATRTMNVGSHSLILRVSDGTFTSTQSFVVQVVRLDQAIQDLIAAVESAGLARHERQPLLNPLRTAQRALDRSRYEQGIHQLKVFVKMVDKHVAARNATLAAALRQSAREIIFALENR